MNIDERILKALDADSGESYVDTQAKFLIDGIKQLIENVLDEMRPPSRDRPLALGEQGTDWQLIAQMQYDAKRKELGL